MLPREFDRIVPYRQTLYWSAQDLLDDFDARVGQEPNDILVEYRKLLAATDLVEYGMTLDPPAYRKQRAGREDLPGSVIGIEVSISSQRGADGKYHILRSAIDEDLILTVLPISEKGSVQQTKATPMAVLNEFKSGLMEVDASNVFVRFDVLQKLLSMHEAQEWDDDGVATGSTLEVSLRLVLNAGADRVIAAVPVGPPATISHLEEIVDAVICPMQPATFFAVGAWYENFEQVSDKTVIDLLGVRSP